MEQAVYSILDKIYKLFFYVCVGAVILFVLQTILPAVWTVIVIAVNISTAFVISQAALIFWGVMITGAIALVRMACR